MSKTYQYRSEEGGLEIDTFLKRYSQRVEVGSLAAEPLGNSSDDEQFRKNGYGTRIYSAPVSIHCIDGICIHGHLRVSGKIILGNHCWLKETSIITDTATQHGQPIPHLNADYDHILSELRPDIGDILRADYPNIQGIALYRRCLFGKAQSLMEKADAKRIDGQIDKIVEAWQAHAVVLKAAEENQLLKTLLAEPVLASIGQVVDSAIRYVYMVAVANKPIYAHSLEVRIPAGEWPLFQAAFSREAGLYNDYLDEGSPGHWLVRPDRLKILLAQHANNATWRILHERYCALEKQRRLSDFISESKRLVSEALEGQEYECPPKTILAGKSYFLDPGYYDNLASGIGEWYTITEDAVWRVSNNGMDGDNWPLNNIRTSGAGAIGYSFPKTDELVALIQARAILMVCRMYC